MKYIINKIIVFDLTARVLMLKNDPQLAVELSKPASRLLSEFIECNNVTLIREDIIKRVWENYGFTPSKGNLNNGISELRKAFDSLGLNGEIIITVPRTGFRMEADIHPVLRFEEATSERETEAMKPVPSALPSFSRTRLLSRIRKLDDRVTTDKNHVLIVSSIFITMVAAMFFFTWPKSEPIRLVTTIGTCNIFGLNNAELSSDFTIDLSKMIESEGVNCINDSADIYYTNSMPGNNTLKVRFMAVCRGKGVNRYERCINYKFVKLR